MGNISIIARRLEGNNYVQYGYSGNGGYYRNLGYMINEYYNTPELIEYLFDLGQFNQLGAPGTETKDNPGLYDTWITNLPHYLAKTERKIFSKIAFIDHGYFYDTDHTWYYIKPGPFRIKIPLKYIGKHLDEDYLEFDTITAIEHRVLECILSDYAAASKKFSEYVEETYGKTCDTILSELIGREFPIHDFYEKYYSAFSFFDDWVVVRTTDDNEEISEIIVKEKMKENREETIFW